MTKQWWVIDGWSRTEVGSVQVDGYVLSTHDNLDDALKVVNFDEYSHVLEIERDPETGSVHIVDAIMEKP